MYKTCIYECILKVHTFHNSKYHKVICPTSPTLLLDALRMIIQSLLPRSTINKKMQFGLTLSETVTR